MFFDFDLNLLALNILSGPPREQAKTVLQKFCFREDIRLQRSKFACQCSQQLRGHTFFTIFFGENENRSRVV